MSSVGSSHTTTGVHKRKSSRDEDDNVLIFPLDEPPAQTVPLAAPPKSTRNDASMNGNGVQHGSSSSLPSEFKPMGPKINGADHGGWGQRSQITNQRSRITSVPAVSSPLNGQFPSTSPPRSPPSSSAYRTSFVVPRSPGPNGSYPHSHVPNGHRHGHQAPAMRQSLSLPSHSAHGRTRSVSGPFSPSSPSPLATSFAISQSASYPPVQGSSDAHGLASLPATSSTDELSGSPPKRPFGWGNGVTPLPAPNTQSHSRRHSRLHSRNLSIFFPRPGSLPSTKIEEDSDQGIAFAPSSSYSSDDGVLIPSASSPGPGQRSFREGFTFGAKPPDAPGNGGPPDAPSGPARRGHHHKHSLSHNFFSFLEPGGNPADLLTEPTPNPVSPWNPISPFPSFDRSTSTSPGSSDIVSPIEGQRGIGLGVHTSEKSPIALIAPEVGIDPMASIVAVVQFVLGATLWVVGQQIGSLSCTGLGYWVVFDSFGVCLAHVLPGYLARPEARAGMRRPYG